MKLLMIVAQNGFRDEEFQKSYDIFKEKQLVIDIASEQKGDCIGKFGLQITADRSFEDVLIQEYLGVVVIGGPGSKALVGNEKLENILNEALQQNIVVAAICYAPVILAKAGLLQGKKATVWNEDHNQAPILKENGIEFVDKEVVTDGMIVTGNGPDAASAFAREVVRVAECSDCWMK